MDFNFKITSENLKDIFYTFGIFTTFILSSVNVYISFINRKNSLRESLYKEQLNFISKLNFEFYKLHSDLSKLLETQSQQFDTKTKIETIFGVLFSNTHISPDIILTSATNTVESALEFLNNLSSENKDVIEEKFNIYFENYKNLRIVLRDELGVKSLSKANQKLYKTRGF
ncbi:hypothetical protein NAT51_10115 [Flavobacterium amniphilum]|uniref:hypothetical protein n=1 Tax=Flavobacterium amniphilum TaxID=1834035 RepID=UPI00202A5FB4|nr:hypothetical protein [Flavobacterium amniphilum]MCL9805878.1 hypothetical protein [Flavobacterium amniphilum]